MAPSRSSRTSTSQVACGLCEISAPYAWFLAVLPAKLLGQASKLFSRSPTATPHSRRGASLAVFKTPQPQKRSSSVTCDERCVCDHQSSLHKTKTYTVTEARPKSTKALRRNIVYCRRTSEQHSILQVSDYSHLTSALLQNTNTFRTYTVHTGTHTGTY